MSEVGVLEEKEDIQRVLEKYNYEAVIFNVSENIKELIQFIENEKIDLIFNLVEGLGEESIHEMHIAGIYDLLGKNYTGSAARTLGICLDKARTKEILSHHKILTPNFTTLYYGENFTKAQINLKYPLFVKFREQDASLGIDNNSLVTTFKELKDKVLDLWSQHQGSIIIEEYIDGRELNIAVIGNEKPIAMPISEISFDTLPKNYPKIVSYNSKWMKGTVEYDHTVGICPADLPKNLTTEMQKIAVEAFKILGLRDYSRVDFRLDENNIPYVLEVNPNPDITDDAGFARSAKAAGYSYEEIVAKIIEMALNRSK